jgi:CBS domain containing-hemolysin-like protein
MWEAVNLVLVFVLVAANGFFVASEFALVAVRRSRIATLADSGDRRARRLLTVVDDLNAYISATQLGITLASLGLGWLGEPAIGHLLERMLHGRVSETVSTTASFAIAFTIITILHIVLGELAPKTLALERAERVALAVAWPMQIFYRIFYWPVLLLDWAGRRTVRLFGLEPSPHHASIYTEEELRQLINLSHQSGHLEKEEQQLINRVFDFSEAEVREAMVPRTAVAGLPVTASFAEVKSAFCTLGYSRMPVYREKIDEICGVLFMKDIIACPDNTPEDQFSLEKLLHPPMFVAATARLGSVLARMQATRNHLAFVLDEHGGIEGIVTLEDLLEEIVGEINDEFDDEVRAQITKDGDGYLLDGMLAIRDANRRLGLQIPEEGGYTTMAGFLLAKSERLLRPGESVVWDGGTFTVEQVDRRRIRRIRYKPIPAGTQENQTAPTNALKNT